MDAMHLTAGNARDLAIAPLPPTGVSLSVPEVCVAVFGCAAFPYFLWLSGRPRIGQRVATRV
jgi:MFS transporter, DHA1 family, multidrug resistance protein